MLTEAFGDSIPTLAFSSCAETPHYTNQEGSCEMFNLGIRAQNLEWI